MTQQESIDIWSEGSKDALDDEKAQLAEISEFNVSARYEDYKYRMYKKATAEYTTEWFKIGESLLKSLNNEL